MPEQTPTHRAATEAMARAIYDDRRTPGEPKWDAVTKEWLDRRVAVSRAKAALTALYAQIPGLRELLAGEARIVPVEATYPMCNAAIDVDSFKLGNIGPLGFRCSPQQLFERCYSAMCAASPFAPPAATPPTRTEGSQ